ncbi:hypothetical protein Zmor_010136 [Zophobas morio]|uniref:Lipase n=2 Tax=Zophobas morio TaxID=2755281 RepID=A0AA38IN85_9CUCU|nr:hypothetical protein Zmor_010136 [Zophobas morio]
MALFSILLTLCLLSIHQVLSDKSDIGLNPGEMVANHGYPSETHEITTDDGYIITLYRIPHGINDDGTAKRPPVLLMHGFSACSGEFVSLGPERGLGYILADAGYDVWLANARGTAHSRKHISIDPDLNPEQFFNFTWHEIAIYDVANSIDYILEVNGDESVYYVGHSQGTTVFLVLASTIPEYNNKIKLANLMAPAAIIKHYPNTFIQGICKYVDRVWDLLQKYRIYEIPLVGTIRDTVTTLCVNYPDEESDPLCAFIHDSMLSRIDEADVPVVVSNCPSGAGLKQYVHYGQLVRDGGFRQWNYGTEKNLEVYGTENPPDYDLSLITTPVAFYYAKNDGLITVEDENTLAAMVPNVAINYMVPDDSFSHGAFAMADDVVELVYNELLDIMSQY